MPTSCLRRARAKGCGVSRAPRMPTTQAKEAPPRVRMSTATARRRIMWNAGGLFLFWSLRWAPQVGLEDVYFAALDRLMQVRGVPFGTDELIDSTLLWLKYALSIVFVGNLVEALAIYMNTPTQPLSASASSAPIPGTPVGEALARKVSHGKAAIPPKVFQTSPVTPVPGASTFRRSASPISRTSPSHAMRTSPFRASSIGLGRPTSGPFHGSRSLSPSSPFAPRSASRASPSGVQRSWSPASMRSTELGTCLCTHHRRRQRSGTCIAGARKSIRVSRVSSCIHSRSQCAD